MRAQQASLTAGSIGAGQPSPDTSAPRPRGVGSGEVGAEAGETGECKRAGRPSAALTSPLASAAGDGGTGSTGGTGATSSLASPVPAALASHASFASSSASASASSTHGGRGEAAAATPGAGLDNGDAAPARRTYPSNACDECRKRWEAEELAGGPAACGALPVSGRSGGAGAGADSDGSAKRAPATYARDGYTICDVRCHVTASDCWLVAHGRVYDVTRFIAEHPGGRNSIISHAGAECSVDFDFHSACAQRVWRKFEIGRLKKCLAGGGGGGGSFCSVQ
jgi:hypothetical protein